MGVEPVKTAQITIIILQFNDFSSDLTHFLAQVKDFRPFLAQVVGAQAPTTEYETTPLGTRMRRRLRCRQKWLSAESFISRLLILFYFTSPSEPDRAALF